MIIRIPMALILGAACYSASMHLTTAEALPDWMRAPVAGLIVTVFAVVAITLVGLPLMLPVVWAIWRKLWIIPLAILILAGLAMLFSWHPALRTSLLDTQTQAKIETFHLPLGIGGWLAMLFAVIYQPKLALTDTHSL